MSSLHFPFSCSMSIVIPILFSSRPQPRHPSCRSPFFPVFLLFCFPTRHCTELLFSFSFLLTQLVVFCRSSLIHIIQACLTCPIILTWPRRQPSECFSANAEMLKFMLKEKRDCQPRGGLKKTFL